jgi:hypothetical protein
VHNVSGNEDSDENIKSSRSGERLVALLHDREKEVITVILNSLYSNIRT